MKEKESPSALQSDFIEVLEHCKRFLKERKSNMSAYLSSWQKNRAPEHLKSNYHRLSGTFRFEDNTPGEKVRALLSLEKMRKQAMSYNTIFTKQMKKAWDFEKSFHAQRGMKWYNNHFNQLMGEVSKINTIRKLETRTSPPAGKKKLKGGSARDEEEYSNESLSIQEQLPLTCNIEAGLEQSRRVTQRMRNLENAMDHHEKWCLSKFDQLMMKMARWISEKELKVKQTQEKVDRLETHRRKTQEDAMSERKHLEESCERWKKMLETKAKTELRVVEEEVKILYRQKREAEQRVEYEKRRATYLEKQQVRILQQQKIYAKQRVEYEKRRVTHLEEEVRILEQQKIYAKQRVEYEKRRVTHLEEEVRILEQQKIQAEQRVQDEKRKATRLEEKNETLLQQMEEAEQKAGNEKRLATRLEREVRYLRKQKEAAQQMADEEKSRFLDLEEELRTSESEVAELKCKLESIQKRELKDMDSSTLQVEIDTLTQIKSMAEWKGEFIQKLESMVCKYPITKRPHLQQRYPNLFNSLYRTKLNEAFDYLKSVLEQCKDKPKQGYKDIDREKFGQALDSIIDYLGEYSKFLKDE